jgi:regulator of protease activity HflC (stomatin/prohibitin superfamily)
MVRGAQDAEPGVSTALRAPSRSKILAEYERGVIFRLGKLLPQPKGPGVILVFAPIDRIVRVSLRTVGRSSTTYWPSELTEAYVDWPK